MPASLLKLPQVISRTGRSRSMIYDEVKRGHFPMPIKVGRRTFWRDDEVSQIVDAYSAGLDASALSDLCTQILHRRRDFSP